MKCARQQYIHNQRSREDKSQDIYTIIEGPDWGKWIPRSKSLGGRDTIFRWIGVHGIISQTLYLSRTRPRSPSSTIQTSCSRPVSYTLYCICWPDILIRFRSFPLVNGQKQGGAFPKSPFRETVTIAAFRYRPALASNPLPFHLTSQQLEKILSSFFTVRISHPKETMEAPFHDPLLSEGSSSRNGGYQRPKTFHRRSDAITYGTTYQKAAALVDLVRLLTC